MAEGSGAAGEVALEGFLAGVDVGVFLEVLGEGEALEADDTDVLLDLQVGSHVASEGESGGVGFGAGGLGANKGSFHVLYLK